MKWCFGGERKGRRGRQANRSRQQRSRRERKGSGYFFLYFSCGSDVGVVVARLSSVAPPLSVAVPLVLPALPPALVVVAPVAVGSSG